VGERDVVATELEMAQGRQGVGLRVCSVHRRRQTDVVRGGVVVVHAELQHRLAVAPRRDRDLRECVRRRERKRSESVAAPVDGLHDVSNVACAIAVPREAAEVSEGASVGVDDDRLLLRGREREEVHRPHEGLGTEQDVPAALDHLDAAIALDRRTEVHVGLRVRVERHRHPVFEDEHPTTPSSFEPSDRDVEAIASSILLPHLDTRNATQHLRGVDGLRAFEVLRSDHRAGPGHALERIGSRSDDMDLRSPCR